MTYAMINAHEVNNEFICSIVDFPNDPHPIVMTICVVKNELEINKISDANFLAIGEKFLSIISTSLCELCEKEKALYTLENCWNILSLHYPNGVKI